MSTPKHVFQPRSKWIVGSAAFSAAALSAAVASAQETSPTAAGVNETPLVIGMTVVVRLLILPLTFKGVRGMQEMQRLAPEMQRIKERYKEDKQRQNQEVMKLYQEHKVNPMASCLPLLAQMPVFIIMFRIMIGLTYTPSGSQETIARAVVAAGEDPAAAGVGGGAAAGELGFLPRFISTDSQMFSSLARETEMATFFGFDLSKSAFVALGEGIVTGLPYVMLVVVLGCLYFFQQRMVAARAAVSHRSAVAASVWLSVARTWSESWRTIVYDDAAPSPA
jgi:YidC/Oxa1 family membrane protein insertase